MGIYIRLKGLGTWPLALDEYYIIKSSENILKFGFPQFPNGGYYTRGILMQYLIAPLLSVGVKAELAGRIFPLLTNLLAIPAIYLISKKIGNQLIAAIAVVIFSFSIWEIEFARFARMYAPFQTIFLWYIYFSLKDFKDKNFTNYKWTLLISIVSIFIYEGSVFLATFNFVPFVIFRKMNIKYFIFALIVFILSVFANTFDFRTMYSNPIFPPEYFAYAKSLCAEYPIKIPQILLPYSLQNIISAILLFVLLIITFYLTFNIIKYLKTKNFWSIASILLLSLSAILNQFGLFILFFALFYLWNLLEINISQKKTLLYLTLIFIINLCFWYLFGVFTNNWYVLFNDFSSYSLWGISKKLLVGFFNYPDNYLTVLNYFRTIPILTLFALLALFSLSILFLLEREKSSEMKFLGGAIIFGGLIATLPSLLYQETRYTFFLIPIVLVLVLAVVNKLAGLVIKRRVILNLGFVFLVLSIFISSKDFEYYHLANIDKREVNYRMIYDGYFKVHLYRRYDIKTPIDFVKTNMGKNDIIMINENSLQYYLPRVDYFNFDYKHHAFPTLSVEGGKKERWSNAKLIYNNEDLLNFIKNRDATIWYLIFPEAWLTEIDFYKKYKEYLVYKGVDGLIKVFKFPHTIK